jgi:hypothetical protein
MQGTLEFYKTVLILKYAVKDKTSLSFLSDVFHLEIRKQIGQSIFPAVEWMKWDKRSNFLSPQLLYVDARGYTLVHP